MQVVLSLECGGLEKLVIGLSSELNKRGAQTSILCLDKRGELAKTIEKYMDETYRKEKSLKAREHVLKNFSKEVMMDQIVGMYKEVLGLKSED